MAAVGDDTHTRPTRDRETSEPSASFASNVARNSLEWGSMARRVRNQIFAIAARILSKPRGNYNPHLPNALEGLRLGDVVLVDCEQRISEVIKYLTQSSWSHSVLYVGDELLRRHPEQRAALRAAYGRDAEHMMIEALSEGVLAAPVTKYAHMNLRVCRPKGLQRDDLRRILDEVLSQLGHRYDLQ